MDMILVMAMAVSVVKLRVRLAVKALSLTHSTGVLDTGDEGSKDIGGSNECNVFGNGQGDNDI